MFSIEDDLGVRSTSNNRDPWVRPPFPVYYQVRGVATWIGPLILVSLSSCQNCSEFFELCATNCIKYLEWFFQNKLSTQWPYGMFPDGHVERSTELQNFRHEMSHRHFCTPFGNTHRSPWLFPRRAHPSKFHELFVAGLVTLCLQHYGPRDFCVDRGKSACTIEMPVQKNPSTTFSVFFPEKYLLDLEWRTFQ